MKGSSASVEESTNAQRLFERRTAPGDFTEDLANRELLDVGLQQLDDKQRRTLVRWAAGDTLTAIAADETISPAAVHQRIQKAIQKLRQLARVEGGSSEGEVNRNVRRRAGAVCA